MIDHPGGSFYAWRNDNFWGDNWGAQTIRFYAAPSLEIRYVLAPDPTAPRSFVTTDRITLRAATLPPQQFALVTWMVSGRGAAPSVSIGPYYSLTDMNGEAEFPFRPADDSAVRDRQLFFGRTGSGSCNANHPIGFEVTASATIAGQPASASLSQTPQGILLQDEQDTLRQEYVDFQIGIPGRNGVPGPNGERIVPRIPGFSTGNYPNWQLSLRLRETFDDIVAEYHNQRSASVLVRSGPSAEIVRVPIPDTAVVYASSSYRCPQRNWAPRSCGGAGSRTPSSPHVQGRALDFNPVEFRANITLSDGRIVSRWVTKTSLRDPLKEASVAVLGRTGTAYCELGPTDHVPCSQADHVHAEWH